MGLPITVPVTESGLQDKTVVLIVRSSGYLEVLFAC